MRRDGGNDLVQEFKDALYTDVEQGPARVEFERRRLMARVAPPVAETGTAPRVRPLALGFAAACAAAAAVLIALAVIPDDPEAGAESISLSGIWHARAGDAFVRGTPVRVPIGGGAKLLLQDGSTLWLGSGAELVALDEDVAAVRLDSGRLLASVARRPDASPFRVVTGRTRITVHGTVFSVASGDDRARVRLHEGEISLSVGDEVIDVQPGHQLEVTRAGEVSLQPIDAAGVLTDLLIAERTSGLAGPVPPEIRSLASEIVMDVEVVALDPSAPEPAAPEIEIAPPSKPRPAPVRPQRAPSRPVGVVEEAPAPEAQEPEAVVDPALAAIEVESAPAPSVIDQLRELTKQGRYADAIQLADTYLAEHPRGEHADDVLYLRAHCQARTGDLHGGRQSLKDYLTRFPEGRYWDRVRDILGE
ncbi:MAG: FecR domain-containing protein [Deltaproteobacteria bacterium]|nr:FecR domain-containing protein [Deltaproteobacteria bacterium]